jgi:hypothetical protein
MNKENLMDIFVNTAAPIVDAALREQAIAKDYAARSAAEKVERVRITQPARSQFKALCDLIIAVGQESGAFSTQEYPNFLSMREKDSNECTIQTVPGVLRLQSGNKVARIEQYIRVEGTEVTSGLNFEQGVELEPMADKLTSSDVVTSEKDLVKLVSTWAAEAAPEKMARYTLSKSTSAPAPKAP